MENFFVGIILGLIATLVLVKASGGQAFIVPWLLRSPPPALLRFLDRDEESARRKARRAEGKLLTIVPITPPFVAFLSDDLRATLLSFVFVVATVLVAALFRRRRSPPS